jgi:hypothetical protein
MEPSAPTSDPLRLFLSGKRLHKRYEVEKPVEISGAGARFQAQARDLSVGGALIAVTESAVSNCSRKGEDILDTLNRCLSDGFDLQFAEEGAVVEGRMVRLSLLAGQAGVFLIGCQFVELLGKTQQELLGLTALCSESGENLESLESKPIPDLPLEPRPGQVVHALVYADDDSLAGPRFAARVVGLGKNALRISINNVDPRTVQEALGDQGFELRFVGGKGLLSTSQASLVGARFLDMPGGGVELALVLERTPARAVRRAFRKRTGVAA